MNARRKQLRGGFAILLVVLLMAAAAIMGFAMLSNASTQSQIASNATSSLSANTLSESGVNLATYYLMYPEKASSSDLTTGTWGAYYNPGTHIPTLRFSGTGTVDRITVTNPSQNKYQITVTGSDGTTGSRITRSIVAVVQVTSRFVQKYAFACNDSFTIPSSNVTTTISGDIRCDNGISGSMSGVTSSTIIPYNTAKPSYPTQPVPSYSQITVCKSLPAYNGGTAQLLGNSISGTAGFPSVLLSNPDAVFYTTGSLTLSGTISLTGTIIVPSNSSLNINSSAVTITTKKTGQPALIVGKDINFTGTVLPSNRSLTVNGLVWLGGNMSSSGGLLPTSQFTVNGAMLWGGSNPKIDTSHILIGGSSYLHVNWPTSGGQTKDPPYWDYLYVPNLCDQNQTARYVKLISLTNQ